MKTFSQFRPQGMTMRTGFDLGLWSDTIHAVHGRVSGSECPTAAIRQGYPESLLRKILIHGHGPFQVIRGRTMAGLAGNVNL